MVIRKTMDAVDFLGFRCLVLGVRLVEIVELVKLVELVELVELGGSSIRPYHSSRALGDRLWALGIGRWAVLNFEF